MSKRSAKCVDGRAWRVRLCELLPSRHVAERTRTNDADVESLKVGLCFLEKRI